MTFSYFICNLVHPEQEIGAQMEFIDINSIKTNNKYLRLDSNVDKLKKSIETVGVINPLVLNLDNVLIAGGRRYSALKELGHTEVPIIRIDKSDLMQELISIDENLVRKDLNNLELEQSLSRGKEIYENIYPEAIKFTEEDLTQPENNELQLEEPNEKRSFIDLTAEKTGLSKRVIKSAIDREERSSNRVKELRATGELNASQTNEIVKLDPEYQDQVADLVKDKSAKEVKEMVKSINDNGIQDAMNEYVNAPHLPKEYKSLKTLLQRANKVLAKILIEEMGSEHQDVSYILDQISTFRLSFDQFLTLTAKENQNTFSENENDNQSEDNYGVAEITPDYIKSESPEETNIEY